MIGWFRCLIRRHPWLVVPQPSIERQRESLARYNVKPFDRRVTTHVCSRCPARRQVAA